MRSVHIHVKIFNPSNSDKALLLANKASDAGFILNSVKTERHFTPAPKAVIKIAFVFFNPEFISVL